VLGELAKDYHGPFSMMLHGLMTAPFWLAAAGVFTAWLFYMKFTHVPGLIKDKLGVVYTILEHKYGFDQFNDWFFAGGGRGVGRLLWQWGDVRVIDGLLVNGSARTVGWLAAIVRHVQSGYLYHYAFAMILGLLVLFGLFVIG